MDSRKINSILYKLLFVYARLNFKLFYRKIHVEGIKNIPSDKPVIFAANHQNALMDALVMLFSTNKEIFFLSRADIFHNKMVAKILTFLKIMPVYRPRDGAETLHLNSRVFEKAAMYLQSGVPLGIFPEGTHQEKKRLFPLKKGICRIAFEAAQITDYNIDLVIVPIGIDYSNFQDRGSDLVVNIGEPIAVNNYYNLYKENPNKAIAILSDNISKALKPLMIHVENLDEYNTVISMADNILSEKKEGSSNHAYTGFTEKQKIVKQYDELSYNDPESFKRIYDSMLSLNADPVPNDSHTINRMIISQVKVILLKLLSLIISLPGILLNLIPLLAVRYKVKSVKDPQFKSSFDIVLSMLIYPLWYIVIFTITWISINIVWATLITVAAIISGLLSLRVIYNAKHLTVRN